MGETTAEMPGTPSKRIGGYEILSKLGAGAMGAVYKARQPGLDRIVALKVLPPAIAKDAKYIERFQREARASAALNHPNIVQGIDVGRDEDSGLWYFAMEFVDGKSLRSIQKEEGALPERRALEYGRDVARALECAAKHGFVHRDIKPDNVLVPSGGEAKLADLGLAKRTESEDAHLTQSGQAVGTPHYMSPEQARGENDQLDIRSDIYSLGATLFHLVTGKPPFEGPTGAVVMSKHLTEKTPLAHQVSERLSEPCSRLIAKMMHKQKEQRIQSPSELIEQIERVLNGTALHTPTRGAARVRGKTQEHAEIESKKNGWLLPAGLGAAVLVVAVLLLLRGGGAPPPERKPLEVKSAAQEPAKTAAVLEPPKAAPEPPKVKPAGIPVPPPLPEKMGPFAPRPPDAPAGNPDAEIGRAPPPPPPVAEAKTVPPPAPEVKEVLAPKPESADRAAYAQFSAEYLDLLRKRDVPGATKRMSQAESAPAIKDLKAELAQDRKALEWMAELAQAAQEGLQKLKEVDTFTLKMNSGPPTKVGKLEEMKVTEVKDDTVAIGTKGISTPLKLEKLSLETRGELEKMGLPADKTAALPRAFLALLSFGTNAGAPSAAAVETELQQAEKAGADAAGVAWIRSKLELAKAAERERRAAAAWADALKLEQAKRWKELLAALDAFEKDYADTKEGEARKPDAAKLRDLAQEEIAKAEGLYFDFKTRESFAAFEKLFSNTAKFSMELAYEDGHAVMRPFIPGKDQQSGAMHLQADSIKMGKNWELSYKINLNLGANEVAANATSQCAAYFHVRFMNPGEKGGWDEAGHARFHCSMISSYEGFFCCALRGNRQMGNGDGPQGPFKGMANLGIAGDQFLSKGKAKAPASEDGRYTFKLTRKDANMKIEVNKKAILDEKLSDEAAALIDGCPLAFYANVVGMRVGIFLEELRIRGMEKGK
ncbi:MAG: protein kinase [Planctomycetes bacterium]|nr:protein kinase [Planctomycetota bacterium]